MVGRGAGEGQHARSWRDQAACRTGVSPETFFPAAQRGPVYDAQVAAAKQVCARCRVLEPCRAWALDSLPVGVAGGLSEQERAALRRRGSAPQPARGHLVEPPPAGSRREFTVAGRAAVAAGEPVASVAARFGVSRRTVERWAADPAPTPSATTGAGAASMSGGAR